MGVKFKIIKYMYMYYYIKWYEKNIFIIVYIEKNMQKMYVIIMYV